MGQCCYCGCEEFHSGPEGGGSMNIRCHGCGKEFCYAYPFPVIDIDRDEPRLYSSDTFNLRKTLIDQGMRVGDKPQYSKQELKAFNSAPGDTDIEMSRVPFWTKVKWCLFGPPGSTGPR